MTLVVTKPKFNVCSQADCLLQSTDMCIVCRPFCDIMFFNSKIRNKIQRVKTRTGRTFNPSESNRKQGYAELRVALDVSLPP